MFDDHESKRCVKDPRVSLEAFLVNLRAMPDLAEAQSRNGGKSRVLEHELGRSQSSLS